MRNRAITGFPMEFIAVAAVYAAVVSVFGFVSVSTGWRNGEWGSDGWPFESRATLLAALALGVFGTGLQFALTRHKSAWLFWMASLMACVVGVLTALAQVPIFVIALLLFVLAAAIVAF